MAIMAQPSVRSKAMAEKDQQQVWDAVNKQKEAMDGGSHRRCART